MLNLFGVIWNDKVISTFLELVTGVTFGEEGLEMGRENEALGLNMFNLFGLIWIGED